MILKLLLILIVMSTTGFAESWKCRNTVEVKCANGSCESESKDGFTPMSVNFNERGSMNVCAYSGCWEGIGKVSKHDNFLTLTGSNLKFSTSPNSSAMRQNVAITIDRNDNVAMLKAGSFALPLICKRAVPNFADYKVRVSKAKPKPIRFHRNKNARMFRTRLRNARRGGINFAGHFIFTSWGCGTSCSYGAIINTKTGAVYFPKQLTGVSFGMGKEIPDEPLQYKKNSRLFILHGNAASAEKAGVTYLIWQGTRFKQVKFVPAN